MSTSNFIKLFNSIDLSKHRYQVFSDFVTMAAYSLHNAINMNEEFEKEYLSITKKIHQE